MTFRMRWSRRARLIAAIVGVLAVSGVVAGVSLTGRPVPYSARNLRIAVVDGPRGNQHVVLDATFFTPAGTGRVPAILLAHGFGETKNAVRGEAIGLARAGFAVLTWSARGFGASTGQIALDSPQYEVKDVEQLVSWLARQPRVLLDHPGDPRVGIAGASYGGAIALLAAAYDHRIDAIVPQITWSNLATALFPNAAGGGPLNGVFKRQWAGLLFTQGSAGFGTGGQDTPSQQVASQCGRFLPRICAIYRQVATLGRPTSRAVSLLMRSSPASVASRIDVPALLIQGMHDSLFGLDQANANYQAIRRNGAPVDMVWFAGGHDGGDQETSRVNALTEQWFDRWLKPPNRPFHAASAAGTSAAFTSAPLTVPVQVTGAPVVRIRVSGAAQVTLFAKVYDVDQAGNATLPDQLAAPLRVTGAAAGRDVTIRLPAIDDEFAAGHRLRLVLTTTDFGYATPPQAATYQVALAGPGLSLPSDPALTVVNGGVPWWTWAAPLAALAAAALILAAGRRREQDTLAGELAGVPLEITGLTKRYHDGQLAVDGLSLRVERGQVLGLLGPNGAGKTTTLRILMGLIHQDAGTIMIFGRPVRPGAPALSRLGSFVEGPGFLPHLSGRANLDLYWRATGRPAGDAHLAHVVAIAGLGAAIDRPVRAFSRGMCQRLAIAQAMLGLPDLLVLDEPMKGLDPPQIRESGT